MRLAKCCASPTLNFGQTNNLSGWHWRNAWCGQSSRIRRCLFGAMRVVSLVVGSMDNAQEVMAAAAEVIEYAVDVLRRAGAMQLPMR